MGEKQEKIKAYIAVDMSLKDISSKVADITSYRREVIWEYRVKREGLSDEQATLQMQNSWASDYNTTLSFNEDTVKKLIYNKLFDKIVNGVKENLQEKIIEEVLDTKVKEILTFSKTSNGDYIMGSICKFGDELKEYVNDKYTFIKDEELEEELKKVSRAPLSFSEDANDKKKRILLEHVEINAYQYRFGHIEEEVTKWTRQSINNNLKYCMKKGKIIVPEEYIAKGETGIKEWQEMKRSGNKNNSIEKKMLKQVFATKKHVALGNMEYIIDCITRTGRRWDIPELTVDGKWNKGKMNKLIAEILSTNMRKDFMAMSDDEAFDKIKEYWKNILMDAYTAVSNAKRKE